MIIVEVNGGLGNQVLEYALYLFFKEKRKDVKLANYRMAHSLEKDNPIHQRKVFLETVFNVSPAEYATDKEVLRFSEYSRSIFSRIRRRILKIRKRSYVTIDTLKWDKIAHVHDLYALIPRLKRKLGFKHNETTSRRVLLMKQLDEISSMKNAYVIGFYINLDFLKGIEDKARAEFTFKNPLDERNQAIANQMANEAEVSVSIHVRRGDYLKNPARIVLSENYYIPAMSYFTDRFGSETVHFYVFSDDIPWCRENIKADKITFIDWNTGDDSYRDMQLMSLCKHNITAHSTFSFSAAWLNTNKDKIIICPRRWATDRPDYDDSVCEGWIVMDN